MAKANFSYNSVSRRLPDVFFRIFDPFLCFFPSLSLSPANDAADASSGNLITNSSSVDAVANEAVTNNATENGVGKYDAGIDDVEGRYAAQNGDTGKAAFEETADVASVETGVDDEALTADDVAKILIRHGIRRPEMRDEIFVQICNQGWPPTK